MQLLIAFVATAVIFLVLDLLWLGVIADGFYKREFGDLIAQPFNAQAAVAFYVIYLIGIMVFAVGPALSKGSITHAALYGAMFGFFCYATYDLTNLATLRGYSARVALVDIPWGTFLTGAASAGGYQIASLFRPAV